MDFCNLDNSFFLSEAGSKKIKFKVICTGAIIILAAHFTKIITIILQNWTSIFLSAIIDSQQNYWRRLYVYDF